MIYGLTHDDLGRPVTRLAKAVKVGFGYPRGAAVHVFIDKSGEWVVETGVGKAAKQHRFASMAEAQRFYGQARQTAGERQYPAKLPYWTFQRIAPNGELYPDWHAIELHGSKPTEVPIVFGEQYPLQQRMEWWSSSELRCYGDGKNAQRRCGAAQGETQQAAAAAAAARGDQWFPIVDTCGHGRCPEASGLRPVCKPHSRLTFLLAKSPSLGATCTYDSTGYRTAVWLSSPIEQVRQITGGLLAGVEMRLRLQAYKTTFNGKPTVQMGATLYMPEADIIELVRRARRRADEFAARQAIEAARQIEPAQDSAQRPEDDDIARLPEDIEASLLTGEFYSDGEQDEVIQLDPDAWQEDDKGFGVKPQRRSRHSSGSADQTTEKGE